MGRLVLAGRNIPAGLSLICGGHRPPLQIDMAYKLLKFKTADELASAAAAEWVEYLSKLKIFENTTYAVALSGGRITKTFFADVVRRLKNPAGGMEKLFVNKLVNFFWADERCVPPDDAESNYRMARELLFEPLQVPDAQIHRLRGEGPEEVALREAEEAVRRIGGMPKGLPIFDMIFLGMGEDGHVASLFPGEPLQTIEDTAVFRLVTAAKPPPRRITLGYGTIANAAEVWVLASGAGKEGALRESLTGGKTPLGRVLQMRSKRSADFTRIYTDIPLPDGLGAGRK
jgi:6-phosphogluconolactonase